MIALVTGGAASGKSAFAEALAVACGGELAYLATMRPAGDEGVLRVARHRAQRAGKGFATVECYGGLGGVLASGCLDNATVLLEDLGNLVANELFSADARADEWADVPPDARADASPAEQADASPGSQSDAPSNVQPDELPNGRSDALPSAQANARDAQLDAAKDALRARAGVAELARRAANLVVVGNEVGCDGVAYGRETRLYQRSLGRLACEIASAGDLVVECVAGVPLAIKAPVSDESFAAAVWAQALESSGGPL